MYKNGDSLDLPLFSARLRVLCLGGSSLDPRGHLTGHQENHQGKVEEEKCENEICEELLTSLQLATLSSEVNIPE